MASNLNTSEKHWQNHHSRLINQFSHTLSESTFEQLLIHSGSLSFFFEDDIHAPFHSNPWFTYCIPLPKHPECCILIEPNKKPIVWIYQPKDFWHAENKWPEGGWTQAFEVNVFSNILQRDNDLKLKLGTHCTYLGNHPEWAESIGISSTNDFALRQSLSNTRTTKTDYEIECLYKANQMAALAHLETAQHFQTHGSNELSLHQTYLKALACLGDELPYPSIIAQNNNCSILHYDKYQNKPPSEGTLTFLIDAGAQHNGYASDITRTHLFHQPPKQDTAYREFKLILAQLKQVQQNLIKSAKPDQGFIELHESMQYQIAQILYETGLVTLSAEQQVAENLAHFFIPHGLGHFLGLQVHDAGGKWNEKYQSLIEQPVNHPFLRLLRPLKKNQVLTIEPGIYFIPSLLKELKQHRLSKHILGIK